MNPARRQLHGFAFTKDGRPTFERFTDRARRIVVLAQEEARLLEHPHIGTEHVLLGMIHEGEGVAAVILSEYNLDLESTRKQVEVRWQGLETEKYEGHIPFTPRAKKVYELALREALTLGHNYIGTEHLLLGLIREGEGMAAAILHDHGLDMATIRMDVIKKLSTYEKATTTTPTRHGPIPVLLKESEVDNAMAWIDHFFKTFPGTLTPTHPLYPLSVALERARQIAE